MTDEITRRKDQHIDLSRDNASQASQNPFDRLPLPYRALPEVVLRRRRLVDHVSRQAA